MKILLTGKNGQVGYELRRSLAAVGDLVAVGTSECDLRDADALRDLLRRYRPDVIVNPAAYTAVEKAETDSEAARAVNAIAPAVMAEAAGESGALLVHFSTDYVFDGLKTGAYTEDDQTNPQNVYGQTKLEGERAIQEHCVRHLILRTSWVLGAQGQNFARKMLGLAAERDSLDVVADQVGAPTSARLLADVAAQLVGQACRSPADFPYGLFHAVTSGQASWHQYACHVIERARAAGKVIRVKPDSIRAIAAADYPALARRPQNCRLDTRRLSETFGFRLPDWVSDVDLVLEQIFQGTP